MAEERESSIVPRLKPWRERSTSEKIELILQSGVLILSSAAYLKHQLERQQP